MKYQSSSIHYSNVINKGINFKILALGQGHKVKNVGIQGKVLNHGILMLNIRAQALPVQWID